MKRTILWILAVAITLGSAVYQRLTGPTHDFRGTVSISGDTYKFKLPRSSENTADCEVAIAIPEPAEGSLEFKRYKTDDPWTHIVMIREDGRLTAMLPRQPAAGKLAYRATVISGEQSFLLTGEDPLVIRFKDPVPLWVIIPHVIIIFLGMLFATRAGLAALTKSEDPKPYVKWVLGFLLVGGFVLGPLVQKYAFGVLWSGFPFGTDLTDNKTLVSLLFWIVAAVAGRKGKPVRGWILAASFVTLVIYLIPHSLLGSELDYAKME